jgi:Arc/MetJ family transcription regulator
MLYAGLDLSRKRLDFHLLDGEGATVEVGAAPPDADGLLGLTRRLDRHREPIRAAIESMNGARFVHDRLELQGWQVEIADAQKVKGLVPLACKTDRIDAWVLAELARRDLVPAIWLPDPMVRAERERARWRLHLVRHRSSLKQRVHAVLLTHGKPCPVTDLFGVRGRQLLARLGPPEPWQQTIEGSLLWGSKTLFRRRGRISRPVVLISPDAGSRRRSTGCVRKYLCGVYDWFVASTTIRRTNINLDRELVEAAAAVLGTVQTTETVHAALREVVDRAARQRLAGRGFADLTPAALEEMRRPRKFA